MPERRLVALLWFLALAHVAGGLALPFLALGTDLFDPLGAQVGMGKLGLAFFGPTVAAFGALLAFLVRHGIARRQRWACDALIAAVLAWLPVDLILCLAHGVWIGVALDLLMTALLLAPAVMLRRRFA